MKPTKIHADSVKEINPRPKRHHAALAITERVSPSIRQVRARIFPLEYYVDVNPLEAYAEILLLLRLQPDDTTIVEVMREAHLRLTDDEYDTLLGYKQLLMDVRFGISAEVVQ